MLIFSCSIIDMLCLLRNFARLLINVPNVGSWEEIPSDFDEELQTFWRRISVDVSNDIHRSKLSHIQHPGLKYFALFLVRRLLARKKVTSCMGLLSIC
jgi:hypothetical protein